MTTVDAPALSAVVLGYGAGEELAAVVTSLTDALERLDAPFEIVIVANYDPGTHDRTPEVAARLAHSDPRARVVALPKAGGMGWDVRSGLAAARGRLLVVMDGDGQNPPGDVVRAYHALVGGQGDVVKGRRVRRADGPYRWLLSHAYNLVFLALFGTRSLWDINGKPKGMTRAAYERLDLRSDDWFFDAELVLKARRLGLRLVEIPVEFKAPSARASFVRPHAIVEFARHLLRYRLSGRP